MNIELKKAIFNFMLDNIKEFQLVTKTIDEFRPYIYTDNGFYLFGGKEVAEFISKLEKLIKEY